MAAGSMAQVADIISDLQRGQESTQQNINPDDPTAQDFQYAGERMQLSGTLTMTAYTVPTDALIMNHVALGWMDDPYFIQDGEYPAAGSVITTILI